MQAPHRWCASLRVTPLSRVEPVSKKMSRSFFCGYEIAGRSDAVDARARARGTRAGADGQAAWSDASVLASVGGFPPATVARKPITGEITL